MVIRIIDHTPRPSTYEDGELIYAKISEAIEKDETVEVSFEGVLSVPSAFVNSAFIRLLEKYPFEKIRSKLKIVDSTKFINGLIRSRFEFASQRQKPL